MRKDLARRICNVCGHDFTSQAAKRSHGNAHREHMNASVLEGSASDNDDVEPEVEEAATTPAIDYSNDNALPVVRNLFDLLQSEFADAD